MKSQSWWYYIDASIKSQLVVYFERFFLFFPSSKRYPIAPVPDHEFFTNSNIAATSPPHLSLSVSRLNGDWKHFQTRFWDNLRFPKLIGFTAPIHSVFFCSLSLTYLLSLSHWFIFNRTSNWITPMAKSGESFENWGWQKLTSTAGRVFTIAASSYFHYSPFFELFFDQYLPMFVAKFQK